MAGGVVGVRGEVGVVAGGLELLLYMGVLCLNCAGRVVVAFGAAGSSVCLLVCKASRAEPAVKNNQDNNKKSYNPQTGISNTSGLYKEI